MRIIKILDNIQKFKTFNLEKVSLGKDLILFGDDHNMNQGRSWLTQKIAITSLKIKYFALEYIETDRQDLIDELDKKTLCTYITEKYKDFPGLDPMSIFDLISESKKRGIKVVGIEMPEGSFNNWELLAAQTSRTKYISQQLRELNKLGFGIALLGTDHAEKDRDNVYSLIPYKKLSVVFMGGKAWSIDTEEYWIRKIELTAQKSGNNSFAFLVKNNEFPCDWVIHFPQTEKVPS